MLIFDAFSPICSYGPPVAHLIAEVHDLAKAIRRIRRWGIPWGILWGVRPGMGISWWDMGHGERIHLGEFQGKNKLNIKKKTPKKNLCLTFAIALKSDK